MNRGPFRFFALGILVCVAVGLKGNSQTVKKAKSSAVSSVDQGKQLLSSNCAACHGIDGKGSERAPNITDSPHVRQLSDAQLKYIIANGISGTGMPAFHSLSDSRVRELIAYLRSFEAGEHETKLPGDPQKGESVFFGQRGCSQCHMIAGRGGFIASDLTDYARTHSSEQIRNAILDPGLGNSGQVRLATALLHNGEKFAGRVRNEDNFSVQLQSTDGSFHLIMKSELEKLDYAAQPLMPNNFAASLTADELNDLISYVLKTSGNADPPKRAKDNDMDNLED